MRDPDRIPRIVGLLDDIWTMYPDLRLGQLLINAVDLGVDQPDTRRPFETNGYNVEDDLVEARLQAYLEYWAGIEEGVDDE